VIAVDGDGNPVRNLTADDFVVKVGGRQVDIRAFSYLDRTALDTGVQSTDGSRVTASQSTVRIVVLLLDDLSFSPGEAALLTDGASRVLGSLGRTDAVGVLTTSGIGPVINPTTDHVKATTALQHSLMDGRNTDVAAPFFISTQEAIDVERGLAHDVLDRVARRECALVNVGPACPDKVAAAARALAHDSYRRSALQVSAYVRSMRMLQKAPRPKVLVVLTAGLPTSSDHDLAEQYEQLSAEASETGVLLYALVHTVDATDLRDLAPDRAAARRADGLFKTSGLQALVKGAGGEAYSVVGSPTRFFERVLNETSGTYELGIERPISEGKAKHAEVSVTSRRKGLTVRSPKRLIPVGRQGPA